MLNTVILFVINGVIFIPYFHEFDFRHLCFLLRAVRSKAHDEGAWKIIYF